MPRLARLLLPLALAGAAVQSAACGGSGAPTQPKTDPTPVDTTTKPWVLAWNDEFDGQAGAAVDAAKWGYDVGGAGWGNRELEYYTSGAENAALDGAGNLVITAREAPASPARSCWYGACRYTSARLLTKGKFAQMYGRFEARIRIPRGQGLWPAFWMLGDDIDRVGWPTCGEIDILENIGKEPLTAYGTLHGPPSYSVGSWTRPPSGAALADGFHTYAVEWEPQVVRFYLDSALYYSASPASLPNGSRWVFDHPHFLILNVAVGGDWPGSPDGTTTFPQAMTVDWVRVWQRAP